MMPAVIALLAGIWTQMFFITSSLRAVERQLERLANK